MDRSTSERFKLIMRTARERLKLNPKDADALFAMAAAQATLEQVPDALQTLERLADLDPNYPGLWIFKTKLHAQLGEAEMARQSRVRAQQSEPTSAREPRLPFACPICEVLVPADATTCANCGVKFDPHGSMEDELDDLSHVAIQEMVQEELSGATKPDEPTPKGPGKPASKSAAKKGLTNGLALGSRAGSKTGKTNGLRGRTNGLRGRTNGLTNGLGRTNGLTNGVGRTNGLTNGLGRTNGLTNGLGRTNGITNGLGRTNGVTNGLGAGSQSVAFHASRRRGTARTTGWKMYLIPLASVSLLLLPLFFIPLFFGPSHAIQIDGQFGDWASVSKVDAPVPLQMMNPDINITRVAVKDNLDYLSFYVEVQGTALGGGPAPGRVTNSFYAFVDVDRSASTGYQVQGIGADRMVRINTWGGQVVSAALMTFDTFRGPTDWNGWISTGPVNAAGSGNRIEFETAWPNLAQNPAPVDVAFSSRSWDGQSDAADLVVTNAEPFLLVRQVTRAPLVASGSGTNLAQITLLAVDGIAVVRAVNVTFTGTFGPSSISAVDLVDASPGVLSTQPIAPLVHFSFSPITLASGDSLTLSVRPHVSSSDGTTVGAFVRDVEDIVVSGGGVAFVGPRTGPMSLAYLGSVPFGPRVDGGFGEWTNLTPDPSGDVQPVQSRDIDLSAYGFRGSGNDTYFEASVVGTFLNGTMVPALNPTFVPATGNGSSNGTVSPPPPPVAGMDYVRFFVDADGNATTGYNIGALGADFLVEITGKNALISTSDALRFSGTSPSDWAWTRLGAAPAAKDAAHIEASLLGVRITNASRAFVQVRGWNGAQDDSTGSLRPSFVSALGLMYSPASGLDPTGITDTSTGSAATGGPSERNIFYDGTNFWAFYYDGSTIQYEPSSDGLSWVNAKNPAFTSVSVRRVSTWFYDSGTQKIAYVVGDTGSGSNLRARRGTISGATITWGANDVVVPIAALGNNRMPFITRDSTGYVWIASNGKQANGDFRFSAIRSTNVDDVSTWPPSQTDLMSPGVVNDFVQGLILPLSAGDMYAIWYADGTIYGKRYTAANTTWWPSADTIDTTTSGAFTKAPSATVDGSFNIHLVYVDTAGAVKYRQRTSSWGSATTLDASSGNSYATVSRDAGTSELYAFYIASTNQIKAQKYSGSWSAVALETNTNAKSGLTSTDTASSSPNIAWTWTQGTASPWDVKFSLLSSSVTSRTIDTSTDSTPLSYNHQRKVFYDGAANYWAFYYDGSTVVYSYSQDALTWENGVSQAFSTSGVDNPSLWFYDNASAKIVYVVGDTGGNDNNVLARRGSISGTTIMWGTQGTVQLGSSTNLVSKIAFITRDSNGYLWVASNCGNGPSTYNVCAVKSTNVDDVSAWGSFSFLMGTGIPNNFVYPTILPLSGGNMYASWYADGAIHGKKYTGSWGAEETIASTTAGVSTKIPSDVVDGSDNVHLVYIDSSGAVLYIERTSSWGSPTTIDATTGSVSPTITVAGTNLYVFWIASNNQIKGSAYTGSWNPISGIEASTIPKGFLTSPYSYSSGSLGFLWGQGGASPWEIKIETIPEFQNLMVPVCATLLLVLILGRRKREIKSARPG